MQTHFTFIKYSCSQNIFFFTLPATVWDPYSLDLCKLNITFWSLSSHHLNNQGETSSLISFPSIPIFQIMTLEAFFQLLRPLPHQWISQQSDEGYYGTSGDDMISWWVGRPLIMTLHTITISLIFGFLIDGITRNF